MLAIPLRDWQRVAIMALLTIPLVLVVIPVMPVLLVSVFLGEGRRQYALALMDRVVGWVGVITLASPPGWAWCRWSGRNRDRRRPDWRRL